jgi:nicotinamide phosphoribosyltransferase
MSREIKKVIKEYADKVGETVSPFHLNDFGFRGVSSVESAGIGGSAHLVNFLGTDTLEGIQYARKYYGADVCGYSVMAAEHSTVTSYTKDREAYAYNRMIDQFPESALLSIVCDSYDTMNAVDNIFGKELKDKILKRSGKFVVRPDSGNPITVSLDILESLWKNFGGTKKLGYKVLDPHVGVIYGDGIDIASIDRILFNCVDIGGFAPSNIVFGMGGALLQQLNRDTQKFAFKCSAARINGKWIDIYKDPVTDTGKTSKKGRQVLLKNEAGEYITSNNPWSTPNDVMQTVFENGVITKEYTFDEVRKNAELK